MLWVLARDMAVDSSIGSSCTDEEDRDVSDTNRGCGRHQIDKGEFLHEIVKEAAILNQRRFGDIERFGDCSFGCGRLTIRLNARKGEPGQQIAAVHMGGSLVEIEIALLSLSIKLAFKL
jgi:hypothetical protein